MLPEVLQHIDDRRPHLARRSQGTTMISVAPDAAVPLRRPIDRTGAAPGQPLDAAGQRLAAICFDHQMDVVGLDRKVDYAKADAIGSCKRTPQHRKNRIRSKRRQVSTASERHENRMLVIVSRSLDVRNARSYVAGFTARATTASSPAVREREIELPEPAACHLDLALFRPERQDVAEPMSTRAAR